MADEPVEIKVTADTSDLQAGMQQGAAAVQRATDDMRISAETMAAALEKVGNNVRLLTPEMLGLASSTTEANLALQMAAASTVDLAGAEAMLLASRLSAIPDMQTYINTASGISREISSAKESAKVFATTLGLAGVSATEAAAANAALGQSVKSMSAAGFADFTNAILGVNRGFKSAEESAKFFAREIPPMQSAVRALTAAEFGAALPQTLGIVTSNFLSAKESAAVFEKELGPAATETEKAGRAFQSMGVNVAYLGRELTSLTTEAAQGRMRMMSGTFLVFLNRALGLAPAIIGMGAAIAAPVAALGYLAVSSERAAEKLDRLKDSFAFAGNLDITTAQIETLRAKLDSIPGVTNKIAVQILSDFSHIKDAPTSLVETLVAMMPDAVNAMGETGDQAAKMAEQLTKGFQDTTGGAEKFAKSLNASSNAITQSMLDSARAADQSHNQVSIFVSKIEAFRTALNAAVPAVDKYNVAIAKANTPPVSRSPQISEFYAEKAAVEQVNTAREKLNQLLDALISQVSRTTLSEQQLTQNAYAIAIGYDHTGTSIRQLTTDLSLLTDEMHRAREGGSLGIDMGPVVDAVTRVRQQLGELTFKGKIEETRTAVAQLGETMDISSSKFIQAEIDKWNTIVALAKSKGMESVEAEREVGRLTGELHRKQAEEAKTAASEQKAAAGEAWRGEVATAREAISAIMADDSQGKRQQLAAAMDVWGQLLTGTRLNALQRLEVEKEYNTAKAALNREAAAEAKTINADNLKTDIEIRKMQIEEEKSLLNAGLKNQEITAQQRTAIMRRLVEELDQLDIQELQNEQAQWAKGTVEYVEYTNKIRIARQKLNNDLATLDLQAAADNKKALDVQKRDWSTVNNAVMSAEDALIQGIFSGRESLSVSLAKLAAKTVEEEIAADLKYYTMKMLLSREGMAAEITSLHGGLLVALTTETAKTNAVVVGTAARTAAQNVSATASMGPQIAAALKSITIDAAKTFGGVFGFLAPIMGPVAAAPATAAEAAVMAGTAVVGLETGTYDVPQNMHSYLHAGEMVVPATFADALRSLVSGHDTYGGSGGVNVTLNYHAHGRLTQADIQDHARTLARVVSDQLDRNPSLRPKH